MVRRAARREANDLPFRDFSAPLSSWWSDRSASSAAAACAGRWTVAVEAAVAADFRRFGWRLLEGWAEGRSCRLLRLLLLLLLGSTPSGVCQLASSRCEGLAWSCYEEPLISKT